MSDIKYKYDVSPELTRQIATRRAVGASLGELEKEFGFSRPVINRVLRSDMAKQIIKGVIDDAVSSAVVVVRRKLADMTELAMETLEHHLRDEKSLEAVKIYFKGLGIDAVEKPQAQGQKQTLQIVLPGSAGQSNKQDIEVDGETIQEG